MRFPDVTLVLLAGGRATRLSGVPKGLLLREGRPLLAHQLELAPEFAATLLVCNDPLTYASFGLRTVADRLPARGPLGGVVTALESVGTEWILCVACDHPFVALVGVEPLLEARSPDRDAVVFGAGGQLEPLCALYSDRLKERFAAAAKAPSPPSFAALLERSRTVRLGEDVLGRNPASGRALVNVNSPGDLLRWNLQAP